MNTALVSAYATVHAATLCFLSLTILNIFLPFRLDAVVPLIPNLKFDVGSMCQELDGAWDETWLEKCGTGFAVVQGVGAFFSTCMMGAQWLALLRLWQWVRQISNEGCEPRRTDIEKEEHFLEEKMLL